LSRRLVVGSIGNDGGVAVDGWYIHVQRRLIDVGVSSATTTLRVGILHRIQFVLV